MKDKPAKPATQFTEQQRKALTAEGVSVALSAGAGCGKTFVLTERFIRQLHPGAQKDRGSERLSSIIAITFTERAAREMRGRIRRALELRLREAPAEEADYWWALLRDLESAEIDTIHAFCASLLRRHAVEAGLDPRFEVLDAGQAALLRSEVLESVLEGVLQQADEAMIDLLARYDFDGLRQRIDALAKSSELESSSQWTERDEDRLLDRWRKFYDQTVWPALKNRLIESRAVRQLRQMLADPPSQHRTMRERFREMAPLLRDDLAKLKLDQWKQIREAAKVQGVRAKDFEPESAYTEFKEAAKEFRDAVDELSGFAFDREAARPAARDGLVLLGIARRVAEEYRARKDAEGVLDFDDLLTRARRLLADNPSLCQNLSRRLELLLVDEFQDTDSVQVELVRALCGDELRKGKLFFVGDYKQSIYRFRGAQPKVFSELREEMPVSGRLPLSTNFRSQKPIIDFVNALFEEAMTPYERLEASRKALSDDPLVEFLWALPSESGNRENNRQPAPSLGPTETAAKKGRKAGSANELALAKNEANDEIPEDTSVGATRMREAEWIARRIRQMIEQNRPVVGRKQKDGSWLAEPPQYKDVAILFRALSDVDLYERALRDCGIPYYLVGGKAFYSQEEVYDLANLLRAIDDPADEAALFGALRSPFFNLLDETLVALKLEHDSLGDALFAAAARWTARASKSQAPAEAVSPRQKAAVLRAAGVLGELRAMKDRVPVAVLIREALARTGFDAALAADFLGERKLGNLEKLIEMAAANDAKGIFSLGDFIVQLVEFVASQPDEALAATEAEDANVVRLMTIHQAKGLEFPIVFIADAGRAKGNSREVAGYSAELGPLIALPASSENVATGLQLFKKIEALEDEAESLRLFYVAATRAADYLVLSHGWTSRDKPAGEQKAPWLRLLAERFDLSDGRARLPQLRPAPRVVVQTKRPEPTEGSRPATRRTSLSERAEKALAAAKPGRVPPTALPVPPQQSRRRQFSFSRLSAAWSGSNNEIEDGPQRERQVIDPAQSETLAVRAAADDAMEEAATLGSWAHTVLANIEPHLLTRPEAYAEWIARLAPDELDAGSDDYRQCIAELEAMTTRFAASPRAARLAGAAALHREIEFLLPWLPSEGKAAAAEQGFTRFAQGYIDCLYQEPNGRWSLIDFKTNRIGPHNRAALFDKYRMQMRLYALAVERALGQKPDEVVLHFLRTGEEHCIEWTDRERAETEREIDRSLARLLAQAE